jgi:hypothetical protein
MLGSAQRERFVDAAADIGELDVEVVNRRGKSHGNESALRVYRPR